MQKIIYNCCYVAVAFWIRFLNQKRTDLRLAHKLYFVRLVRHKDFFIHCGKEVGQYAILHGHMGAAMWVKQDAEGLIAANKRGQLEAVPALRFVVNDMLAPYIKVF